VTLDEFQVLETEFREALTACSNRLTQRNIDILNSLEKELDTARDDIIPKLIRVACALQANMKNGYIMEDGLSDAVCEAMKDLGL